MKSILLKISVFVLLFVFAENPKPEVKQEFQGKAYYFSKSKMELGRWGARLSEAQKKQIAARMKNRLEKTYVLTFNKEESFFEEEDKLDAMSGATDSWGKNFAPGDQYKNVKTNTQIQTQEFYGKKFLVKDNLQPIEWVMGSETKQIGNYMCFKATASVPTNDLTWYNFSWDRLRNQEQAQTDSTGVAVEPEVKMTEIEAWYTVQIPVRHGPLEYWGLPGLILEVSADNTTMLCSKIVLNPEEKIEIVAPNKGKEITKTDYQQTITAKMKEFRDNRGRRRS
ncbi:GLPGLI family protein [Winogradskyella alexanderae]|uniref:GLPGLI family protein n=1 Tax=Winogradskyella alexanderae TaxID=2877123 RepID=A0ABS7XTI6_9FLAO|nr:GLPGLI family protein [Winogradskyella alexanderae]MCA0133338.1 GLPGLI family protein [Winogradskyella alexanderae]